MRLFNHLNKRELESFLFEGEFTLSEEEEIINFIEQKDYRSINDPYLLSTLIDASITIDYFSNEYANDLINLYSDYSNQYLRLSIIDYLDANSNRLETVAEILKVIYPLDNRLNLKIPILTLIYNKETSDNTFRLFKESYDILIKNHNHRKTYYRVLIRLLNDFMLNDWKANEHNDIIAYVDKGLNSIDKLYRSEKGLVEDFKNRFQL